MSAGNEIVRFDIYGAEEDADLIDPSKVRSLLMSKPEIVSLVDLRGNTLLHEVILSGDSKLIEELIQLGTNVNAKGIGLNTPLHVWARSAKDGYSVWDRFPEEMIRIGETLLVHGAEPEATNSQRLPLSYWPLVKADLRKRVSLKSCFHMEQFWISIQHFGWENLGQ
jgi:hypothetical protein